MELETKAVIEGIVYLTITLQLNVSEHNKSYRLIIPEGVSFDITKELSFYIIMLGGDVLSGTGYYTGYKCIEGTGALVIKEVKV